MIFRLIACLLLCFPFQDIVFAQGKNLFHNEISGKYIFSNISHPDAKSFNTSYFINEIALSQGEAVSSVNYSLAYTAYLDILEKENILEAIVDIHVAEVQGATAYRKFDIADVLQPSMAEFRIYCFDKEDRIVLAKTITGSLNGKGISAAIRFRTGDTGLRLELSDLRFYYSQDDRKAFVRRMGMINDYYGSSMILDQLLDQLKKLDEDADDALLKFAVLPFDFKQVYKILSKKPFLTELNINRENDPLFFYNQLQDFSLKTGRMNTLFEQEIYNKQRVARSKVPGNYFYPYFKQLEQYMHMASKAGHYFEDSFYELLARNYSSEGIREFFTNFQRLLKYKINPNPDLSGMSKLFFENYLVLIDYCIENENYNEALEFVEGLGSFCNSAQGEFNRDLIRTKQARAISGLYNSLLSVAIKAIQVGNYSMAETYLRRAENFQENNSKHIINKLGIWNAYGNMADAYLKDAAVVIDKMHYEAALANLDKARQIIEENPAAKLNQEKFSELKLKAGQAMYEKCLAEASTLFNKGEYAAARKWLNKAEQYQADKNGEEDVVQSQAEKNIDQVEFTAQIALISQCEKLIRKGEYKEALEGLNKLRDNEALDASQFTNIDSLIEKAARMLGDKLLYEVSFSIWNEDLQNAYPQFTRLQEHLQLYRLESDPYYRTELRKIREKMNILICNKRINEYEKVVMHGFNLIDKRDFIAAEEQFLNALNLLNNLEECDFTDSIPLQAIQKYASVSEYQKSMKRIRDNIFEQGFSAVIPEYLRLDTFYIQNNITRYGIRHDHFEQFLMEQQSPDLVFESIEYFMNNKRPRPALQMLFVLKEMGLSRHETVDQQKAVAIALAINDYQPESEIDYKQKIENYTHSEKWFSFFKRSYRWQIVKLNLSGGPKTDEGQDTHN